MPGGRVPGAAARCNSLIARLSQALSPGRQPGLLAVRTALSELVHTARTTSRQAPVVTASTVPPLGIWRATASTMEYSADLSFRPLSCDAAGLEAASAMLHAGSCVAFPTETVYGLGANALDESAVLSIFRYKGRPLTDPLIVHVDTAAKAVRLVRLPSPRAEAVFNLLAATFWPGPLTLVARACEAIPLTVTAGTGFVGVRVPAHPVARALLAACDLPIAAPSANRFGHVSPTRALHVIQDLGVHPVGVLMAEGRRDYERWAVQRKGAHDGTAAAGAEAPAASATTSLVPTAPSAVESVAADGPVSSSGVTCGVGIESTVVKIEAVDTSAAATSVADTGAVPSGTAPSTGAGAAATGPALQLVVFRRGGVSVAQLQATLAAAGFADIPVVFRTMHNTAPVPPAGAVVSPLGVPADAVATPHPQSAVASASASPAGDALRSEGSGAVAPPPAGDAAAAEPPAAVVGSEAPGMLLTHYAPDVDTYLATGVVQAGTPGSSAAHGVASLLAAADSAAAGTACAAPSLLRHIDLRSTVVLDFGGLLRPLLHAGASTAASGPVSHAAGSTLGPVLTAGGAVLAYRDLAASGSVAAAAAELFDALRWTETVPGAKAVLVADPLAVVGCAAPAAPASAQGSDISAAAAPQSSAGGQGPAAGGVDVDALRDRMFRAASGRVVAVQL